MGKQTLELELKRDHNIRLMVHAGEVKLDDGREFDLAISGQMFRVGKVIVDLTPIIEAAIKEQEGK